jgi:hypothetical protein
MSIPTQTYLKIKIKNDGTTGLRSTEGINSYGQGDMEEMCVSR